MASSLDTILGSMRDLGSSFNQAGQSFESAGRMQSQNDETKRRADAEKIRKDRLGELSNAVDAIVGEAKDNPDFDQEAFVDKAQPIIKGSIELGDPAILRSLDPIQEIINQRRKDLDNAADTKLSGAKEAARARKQNAKENARDTKDSLKEATRAKEEADKAARDSRKEVREIRKLYDDDDITKKTNEVRQAFGKIVKSSEGVPTAAKDMSLVYNFMKILDPGSVVRESEFKTAAEARSFFSRKVKKNEDGDFATEGGTVLPSFLVQAFQKSDVEQKGAFLLPEQRVAFSDAAEENFRAQLDSQRPVDERTMAELTDIKGDRKNVIPKLADEDLAGLDARRKARTDKEKDDSLNVSTGVKDKSNVSAGNEGAKIVDHAAMDKIFAANAVQFKAVIDQINKGRAAAGQPPVSSSEENTIILKLMEKNGIQSAPGGGK